MMRKILSTLMVVMAFALNASAQKTVTGTVTDPNGKPVSNASVVIPGNKSGTSTDAEGKFTLSVPTGTNSLMISAVNFENTRVMIRGNSANASLILKKNELEEVVVTGISRIKKSQFAGAATKITARDMENKPVGSFDQILQGRAPGLLALNGSGQPGNASTIIIRGQNSIAGGSTPLYIVDGIQMEASTFQGLNPNDFATVDVLRDAATQALYGSRGSAGVIVVTTKRGTAGKVKVSYSGQLGIKSTPDFAFRPMTTAELLQAQHDYGKVLGGNDVPGSTTNTNTLIPGWYYAKDNPRYGALSPANQAIADSKLDSISKINTDWYDAFFRSGNFSNHEVNLSGGTGKTRFYTSVGLYNEQGTINPSDMTRATVRNNIDFADDKFTFSASSTIGYVRRNFEVPFPGYIFNSFLTPNIQAPYSKLYNPDGSLVLGGGVASPTYFGAQLLDLKNNDKVYSDQVKVNLGFNLAYKITSNITAALTTGVDFRETQNSTYNSRLAYIRTPASGQTGITTLAGAQTELLSRFLTSNVRPSVTFQKMFAKKHDIEVTALGEYVQENSKGIGFTGYGIDPRTPNTAGVIQQGNSSNQLYANISAANNGKTQTSLLSALGLARYTYNNKYTITGSFRRDGSSYLPEKNRWTNFYSVGGIWDITKEKFLNNSSAVNVLRLRASYGISGNANNFPQNYLYQATYASGTYSGLPTQVVNYVGNPDAKWETTGTLNIGTDFEFFNRRLYGDLNWYDKRTKDLFVQKTLAFETSGAKVINVNAGELQNTGFEWNLNFDVVRNKDITWTLFSTGSYNKNKLLSLGGEQPYESGTSYLQIGLPLGTHYEVKWGGVDAATGQPLYYNLKGELTNVYAASDAVTDFGTWEAPWKGGFGTNILFRGFDLSALFSWQQGANKVDNLEYFVENPNGFLAGGYNQSSDLNFWKKPGDKASTPSPVYGTSFSSKIIHDASFVRLRDLTLGYTFTKLEGSKKFISKARFFVQGSNLFMWTKWRGMDPEAGSVNLNLSEYPNPRAFTAGINVTF